MRVRTARAYGEIGVVQLDLVDETRPTPAVGAFAGEPRRRLPTTVYLPAGDHAAPLIVLAHGFNGHPNKFTDLARHWAQAGYVVAVPRFPVSNDGFPERDPAFYNARIADVAAQADDVAFVVGEARAANDDPSGALLRRIEPSRLGLYGLSLGALTVWTAAESRLDTGVVTALIQSDSAFPGDRSALAGVSFPVFIAHSDVDPIFPCARTFEEYAALPSPKFLLVLHGAAHAAVGENTPTAADPAYRRATTAFWDRYLGDAADAEFPEPELAVDGVTSFFAEARLDV